MPVGTLYGIGKNYAAHAREMGGEVPSSPMVFIKPPASYLYAEPSVHAATPHPSFTKNLHHEVELVVVIGEDSAGISAQYAHTIIAGYGIGLDMTLRDVQNDAKTQGSPWAVAKGYVGSAPCSQIIPASEIPLLQYPAEAAFNLEFRVNDEIRQQGTTANMERSVATLIEYLSHVFTLRKGDCIFTGTPEGVGRVVPQDRLFARLSADNARTVELAVTVAATK